MIRRITIIIFVFICINEAFSQNILNGSFENNNESGCAYNLNNSTFNSSMQDVNGFGTYPQLDIQTNGCDVMPQHGNWCVGVATFPWGGHDAITLELTSPLSIGFLYELTFWTYNNTYNAPNLGLPQDSIEIGLTMSNNTYGQKIYTSFSPLDTWQMHTIQFVADSGYSFISVYTKEDFSSSTWYQVDNFFLSDPLATGIEYNSVKKNPDLLLCPNPASDHLIINQKSMSHKDEVKITGITSQVVKVINDWGNVVDISDLPNGVYILELNIEGYSGRTRFIKQ